MSETMSFNDACVVIDFINRLGAVNTVEDIFPPDIGDRAAVSPRSTGPRDTGRVALELVVANGLSGEDVADLELPLHISTAGTRTILQLCGSSV